MKKTLQVLFSRFAIFLISLISAFGWGQTIVWSNTGASTAWYTNTNWTPNTSAAAWTTSNVAQFANAGTATTAGINMVTASLSIGAVEVTSARTRALTIGSSSSNGTLTLNGATINSVANTVLRNNSGSLLTIQDNETGTGKTMGVVLNNTTDNIFQIDGAGGVTISSIISGTGKKLTKSGVGAGVLTLTGANTYTGGTTASAGEIRFNPSVNLSLSGDFTFNGGTLSTTGITATRTITFANLVLANSSAISLATATAHRITFTTGGTFTSGKTLTINGWQGTAGSAGTQGRIFVGSTASSLTASQLSQITFTGFPGGAMLLATGELVPAPTYNVTYNGNGSTGGAVPTDSSNPYVSGSNVTVIGNTGSLVKSGYNFVGWTTDAANLGTVFNAGDIFNNITSNTVFYAKWVSAGGVNGVIDTNEYGTGNVQTEGSWYMKSDATNLYIGIVGANLSEGAVVYLDKDAATPVNSGAGIKTGNVYDGSNFSELPFNADLVIYFKDSYQEYRTVSGSSWGTAVTSGMTYASNGGTSTREIAIPWSAIGGQPAKYNWLGYVAYSGGGAYSSTPSLNPGGSGATIIGASANWNYYKTVVTATAPFTNTSYTFTGTTDANNFGPISVYDLTMNSAGRWISRTGGTNGAWNIGNDLVVGAGNIYLGTGANPTNVSGSLNMLGGNLDMGDVTSNFVITNNATIASGSTLKLSNVANGDLKIAGNWNNAGTFTPNGRAVFFNGSGTQTITNASGETFSYLIHDGSGLLEFNNHVTVNGNSGDVLQLLAGTIDLKGKNLTLSGTGIGDRNIKITGTQTLNSTVAGSIFNITGGTKTVTSGTSFIIPSNVTTVLNNGIDFGSNLTTIQGILRIASGGFVQNNAPIYTTNSTLDYNGVTSYGVGKEWDGSATTVGAGVPNAVTLTGNSSVNMPDIVSSPRAAASININAGSTLNQAATQNFADIIVFGNGAAWTNNGTLNANNRTIIFQGTVAQTINGTNGNFGNIKINNATGVATNVNLSITNTIDLTLGKLTLGTYNATTGTATNYSAASYVVTNSTGQLKRNVAASDTIFPVGNSSYNPITFNNTGTADVYGVRVLDGALTTANVNTKTVSRRWVITEAVAGGSNLSVVAQYNTGEHNTGFNAAITPKIGFYNGTAWSEVAATAAGANPFTFTSNANSTPADLTTGTQYFAVGKDDAFVITYYTVTFDKNAIDATGTMSSQSIASGTSAALTTNAYTRAGYTFTGWNTLANGTGTAYANGASYTMGGANVTLYAQWALNPWEDFETGTKTGYAAGDVNCTAGSWNLSDALLGTSASDRKSGAQSVRIQNAGTLSMNFDIPTGLATVTVAHAIYGSDASSTWRLEASTDSGATWGAFTSSTVTTSSTTLSNQIFTVNLSGNVRFRIVKLSGGGARLNIDNIYITNFVCSTTPANPNGSITGTTPACTSTTLTYTQGSGQPETDVTYFWQTSATGTSTTNNASSPLNVSTSGTYYVRGKNAEGCWSTGASTGYTVVINSQPSITTNPSNAYVQEGATATFTIAGINLTAPTTIQWQVSTNGGGSWTNISGANATSLSVTSTTVALSGNQYRAVVSNGGCTTVNSTAATLRVYYTPPNNGTSIKACLGNTSATISWTAASGATANTKYLVFAFPGTTAPAMAAASAGNGIDYVANADYNAATTYSTLGKALYNGSGTSVTVTGLTNLSQYTFKVVAYNYDTNTGWASAINASGTWNASFTIDTPEITSLTATIAPTSSVVSWNVVPSSAGCYEYLVVANQGAVTFTPTGDGTAYIPNTVYAGANQVIYKGSSNTVTLTGLTEGLQYCYKVFVRELNSNQWSDGTSVCATTGLSYCTSNGNTTYATGVTLVNFNTINSATTNASPFPAYTDFTGTSTNVNVGASYPLTVNVHTAGNYTVYTKVWIDWNRNGTFDTGTEEYDLGTATNVTNGITSLSPLSITVPTNATLGATRMRVSAKYASAATPCATGFDGEVEDYTLNITRPANAEINIKGNNIAIQNGEESPYGLNNTLFASTNIGADSVEKEFIIENIGASTLNLTGTPVVQITGANAADFIVTLQAANSVAGSGTSVFSTNFKVKFHPTAAGVRTAYVSIANNDSDENPFVYMIQGTGVCSGTYTGNFYPISGPANTELKITSATDLTGATVTYGGVTLTPTSSTSGEIIVKIPVGAVDDNVVVQLTNGCTISQYFDVINTLKTDCAVVGGSLTASDLFISQITDSGTDAMTYIELYNGTGASVSLDGYNIKIFNNGNATATSTMNLNNVVLANNSTYVLAVGTSNPTPTCGSIYGGNGSLADQSANQLGGINFSKNGDNTKGHDYVGLYKNSTLVDSWGVYQNESWAISLNLGGQGANFSRKSSATLPNVNFSAADWDIQDWGTTCDTQDYSGIGSYVLGVQILPTITAQPSYSETCEDMLTLSVTGTEGVSGGLPLAYQWYELAPNSTTWTSITGANSNTYSVVLVDKIGYQFYAQVRENTATCYTASQATKIIDNTVTYGASGWLGSPNISRPVIVASNFDVNPADSFEACRLVLNNGIKFTIKEDAFVRVYKGITNNSVSTDFIVENNANLIQVSDAGVNNGSISVRRNANLKRLDYNYWGAPVASQNLRTFSTGTMPSRFYTYNEATDGFVWIDPYNNTFTPAKGYAIRASNTAATTLQLFNGEFRGVPNNGGISLNLSYTDAAHGYNLVANPYPSNIDLDQLYALNSGDITGEFYFWTNINPNPAMQYSNYPQLGYYNNYAVYNASGGVPAASPATCVEGCVADSPTPTNIVKPGQGFIVRATGAARTLDFNNSIRNSSSGVFFNRNATHQNSNDRFWIQLMTPMKLVNTILIAYKEGSTKNFEENFDSKLLVESPDSFYSKVDNKKLIIQGRGYPFKTNDKVPLGASFYQAGVHIISLAKKEGEFSDGQPIYLHDKKEAIFIDLQQQEYSFIAEPGESTDRFEIVYNTTNKILATNEYDKYGIQVYEAENHFVIKADKAFDRVKIYDISGKLLKTIEAKNKQLMIEKSILNTGTNVFSIIFAEQMVNKKIILTK